MGLWPDSVYESAVAIGPHGRRYCGRKYTSTPLINRCMVSPARKKSYIYSLHFAVFFVTLVLQFLNLSRIFTLFMPLEGTTKLKNSGYYYV
jgi:hypothetical protein